MGALDAFYSTWSKARQTFGQGTPQDGTQFDASSKFQQAKAAVEAATAGSNWQGPASEAYAAKNNEHAKVFGRLADLDKRMAAEVTNAANVVAAGRQNLDQVKSWVTSAVNSIPSDTSATDRDKKLLQIAKAGISKVSNIVQTSTGEMNAIGGRVQTIKGEFAALGNEKSGPGAEKPDDKNGKKDDVQALTDKYGESNDGPGMEGFTPEHQADRDVEDALATGDPEAAARIDEALSSIQPGEPLSREQDAYLTQMQKHQKGMSVQELAAAEERLGDHKNIMGDSWQLMSNDDVKYSGGAGKPPEELKGSASQLPDSVQEALREAGETTPSADYKDRLWAHGHELGAIAQIVKDGDPQFQTGTELDRQIICAADRMMDSLGEKTIIGTEPVAIVGGEETIQTLFEAVDDDHQIINDHLMGRNGVDANDFLHDVNTIDWKDNGKAAGYLFSWTGENGGESQIAAETADKYAEYIGAHRHPEGGHGLMDINGQTLGQLNPELVQGYARGLVPFIDDMAGSSASPYFEIDNDKERLSGLMPDAKGVFAVLNTDAGAAELINKAAYSEAMKHETAFAKSPGDPLAHQHLTTAATMRGLVDVGAHEAFQAFQQNGYEADKTENQWKKSAFDAAVAGFSTGGALVPEVGFVAGPVISQVGAVFSQELFDTPPGPVERPLPQLAEPIASTVLLDAMLAAGHQLDLPNGYVEGGHVVHPKGVDDGLFEAEINQEIGQRTVVVAGNGPDEVYTNRYNLVIQDPDIQRTEPKGVS